MLLVLQSLGLASVKALPLSVKLVSWPCNMMHDVFDWVFKWVVVAHHRMNNVARIPLMMKTTIKIVNRHTLDENDELWLLYMISLVHILWIGHRFVN